MRCHCTRPFGLCPAGGSLDNSPEGLLWTLWETMNSLRAVRRGAGKPRGAAEEPPRATPPASPGQQSNMQAHGCTGHLRTVGCFGPCGGPQSFSRPREPRLSRQHGSARPHPRPGLVMQMPGVQSSSAALSRSPRGETARTPASWCLRGITPTPCKGAGSEFNCPEWAVCATVRGWADHPRFQDLNR